MTSPTRSRALAFNITQSTQYNPPHRTENAYLTMITHEDHGQVRGCAGYGETDRKGSIEEAALQDLRVGTSLATNMDSASYGWEVCYHRPYQVNLRTAERMLKTMRTIERRMDKIEKLIGRPANFGQYVARAAQALGATEIAFEIGERRTVLFRDVEYQYLPIHLAVDKINNLIAEWHMTYPSTRQRYEDEALAAG